MRPEGKERKEMGSIERIYATGREEEKRNG
jgi:hypothetical protein